MVRVIERLTCHDHVTAFKAVDPIDRALWFEPLQAHRQRQRPGNGRIWAVIQQSCPKLHREAEDEVPQFDVKEDPVCAESQPAALLA